MNVIVTRGSQLHVPVIKSHWCTIRLLISFCCNSAAKYPWAEKSSLSESVRRVVWGENLDQVGRLLFLDFAGECRRSVWVVPLWNQQRVVNCRYLGLFFQPWRQGLAMRGCVFRALRWKFGGWAVMMVLERWDSGNLSSHAAWPPAHLSSHLNLCGTKFMRARFLSHCVFVFIKFSLLVDANCLIDLFYFSHTPSTLRSTQQPYLPIKLIRICGMEHELSQRTSPSHSQNYASVILYLIPISMNLPFKTNATSPWCIGRWFQSSNCRFFVGGRCRWSWFSRGDHFGFGAWMVRNNNIGHHSAPIFYFCLLPQNALSVVGDDECHHVEACRGKAVPPSV